MRTITLVVTLVVLTGCGLGVPNVKARWTKNLQAYSFVPLYPARSDVEVGDIRVHLVKGGSNLFDSRLLWKSGAQTSVLREHQAAAAILPGLEVVRLGAVDFSTIGLRGLLGRLFGTRVEANESLHIALKDLTTTETSDIDAAANFRNHIRRELGVTVPLSTEHPNAVGFCAAAISLNYQSLDDVRVSMVTRTVSAKKISYFSGRSFTTFDTPSSDETDTQSADVPQGQTGVAAAAAEAIRDNHGELDKPVVVGVDALMLKPAVLNPALEDICKKLEDIFDAPPGR